MQFFWGACLKTAKDADHPYASPLCADTLRDVAPAMILTAEFDPLVDEGYRYGERLRAAGVPGTNRAL